MRPELRLAALVLLLPCALAGCNSQKSPPSQATAGGEILPGSASDAMLPVDSVKSQPPLAPKPESSGKAHAASGAAGPDAADTSEAAPADKPSADAPVAEPKSGAE